MANLCPMCKAEMVVVVGDKNHLGNKDFGITVYCVNNKCTAEEVMGHGDKEKDAYQVVLEKFKTRYD